MRSPSWKFAFKLSGFIALMCKNISNLKAIEKFLKKSGKSFCECNHHEFFWLCFEMNDTFELETGIKIILDYVPNHTSDKHEWFIKSEARDPEFDAYYIWKDGKPNPDGGQNLPPNNWVSVFYGSAWTWSDKRQQYYFHQFTRQQPDLNYRNPVVLQKMEDVLRFWLAKGVSGFRCDAVKIKNKL